MMVSVSMGGDSIDLLCPPPGNAAEAENGNLNCSPVNSTIGFNMLIAEMIGTFVLCSVILFQKYNATNTSSTLKAFAIGLSLVLAECMIGGITSGCLNPAVGFVQTVFQDAMIDQRALSGDVVQTPGYGSMWLYLLGPALGGILAGLISKLDESARDALKYKPLLAR